MRNITLLILFVCSFSFAQNPTNYLEAATSNYKITPNTDNTRDGLSDIDDNLAIIDTYTVLGDFLAAVDANCSDTTLTSEDFSNGSAGITACGLTVSSAGDGCFTAGELEPGFTVEASNASDVVLIAPGSIGNTDALVGAINFAEFTIINFSPDVYAVGMDIWENIEPTTIVRVFGAGDALIDTFNLNTPVDTQTFFGVIADEPITSIELEGLNGSGELFGNFLFGADCMSLSIAENIKDLVRIYPNPVNDNLFIDMPARISMNEVLINDILGKSFPTEVSNGQIDTSKLESGVYFLTITTNQGKLTKKFIRQ